MRASTPHAGSWLAGALCLAVISITACRIGPTNEFSTGVIEVAVSTTGADPDPDGYVATLEGDGNIPVPATGSAHFNGVADGDYTVALGGLASNCTADAVSKPATVKDGATATVSFAVTCSAIPQPVGSIRVVTSTIGSNPDLDGYQFSIDNGPVQAIGTSSTATVNNLALGLHTVVISGVASNCGIPRGWLEEPMLTAGDTADALFPVTCHEMGPSLSESTVQVDPASIPVGFPGMIFLPSSTITVTVVDPSGTPLPGFAVTLGASGSGNTISEWPGRDSGTTDARGMATFSFSSTIPEPKIITATVNDVASLENTQLITVVKAISFVGIIAADPEPSAAGETFVVTVSLGGEHGSRPTGGTVTVSSNLEPEAGCDAGPVIPAGETYSTASCEMSLTIVSTHMLTATYSGDSQFEGSTGTAVEHVVIAP